MEVRAQNGKGHLLFEWNPETHTIELIRKNMFYKVYLDNNTYIVEEEHPKHNCKKTKAYKYIK